MKKLNIEKKYVILVTVAILSIFMWGIEKKGEAKRNEIKEIEIKLTDKKEVSHEVTKEAAIYIPEENYTRLEKVQLVIEETPERERTVNEILMRYSKELQSRGEIKTGLVLQNSFFLGNTLYLNFQGTPLLVGSDDKLIYVAYSIANSIIDNVNGVEKIKFLVDNQEQNGVLKEFFSKNTKL